MCDFNINVPTLYIQKCDRTQCFDMSCIIVMNISISYIARCFSMQEEIFLLIKELMLIVSMFLFLCVIVTLFINRWDIFRE